MASNKQRHKEIVALLNAKKGAIDRAEAQLQALGADRDEIDDREGGEGEGEGRGGGEGEGEDDESATQRKHLTHELEAAKRAYRGAHKELQLCKEQIAETQSLKKRAIASLLSAYAEYEKTLS